MKFLCRDPELLERLSVIDFNWRKSVVVHTNNLIAANELGRLDCIVNAHGECVTKTQNRKGELRRFTNQLHVRRQRRVARIVKITVLCLDDEPAGVASSSAIVMLLE